MGGVNFVKRIAAKKAAEEAAAKKAAEEAAKNAYVKGKERDLFGEEAWALKPGEKTSSGDHILRELYKKQGYDGLPLSVSSEEFDALPGDVIWRGIGKAPTRAPGIPEGLSDAERQVYFSKQIIEGQHYPGVGIYGNGTYTVGGPDGWQLAADYATKEGSVVRMKFRPDAKLISIDDLEQISRDYLKKIRDHKYDFGKEILDTDGPALIADEPGRLATWLGYDGYYIPRKNYYVVLNRTALIVDKEIKLP